MTGRKGKSRTPKGAFPAHRRGTVIGPASRRSKPVGFSAASGTTASSSPEARRPVSPAPAPKAASKPITKPTGAGLAGRPSSSATPGKKPGLPRYAKVAFGVVFVYLIAGFGVQLVEVFKLSGRVHDLEDQAAALEADNARLAEEIDYSQTDAYIEQVAREELGLIWPNEVPYAQGTPEAETGDAEAGN